MRIIVDIWGFEIFVRGGDGDAWMVWMCRGSVGV